MTYFEDIYKRRGRLWGTTSKEQLLNISKKYFEDYLLNGASSETIVIDSRQYTAAVHDNKDDENKISKHFLLPVTVSAGPGTLISWYGDYWLIVQKEKRSFEAYNKFLAFRCNNAVNWIDEYGILKTSPCYLFSTMGTKVENNFKIAVGKIVFPNLNKRLNIILPYQLIKNEQRFIINSEAWRVVERDLVSVNGILYLSLEEDLIDSFDDDIVNNIADSGKLNDSTIDIGIDTLSLEVGESFIFNPILYKDGKLISDASFAYTVLTGSTFISMVGSSVSGVKLGTATIEVYLIGNEELKTSCSITVVETSQAKKVLQLM
ncbi:MAG: hypothetical protein M0R38_12365, partial [Bacteroidia bacterium]|nr:hypothetical protein [Bacteroidia bacterium]